MMLTRFIELHNQNGTAIAINPANVSALSPSKLAGMTDIILVASIITVKGAYADVKKKLEGTFNGGASDAIKSN